MINSRLCPFCKRPLVLKCPELSWYVHELPESMCMAANADFEFWPDGRFCTRTIVKVSRKQE